MCVLLAALTWRPPRSLPPSLPRSYKHPEAFTDVTEGNNRCSTWQQCCTHGFYAQAGWDPVTGLGSPRYDVLSSIVLQTGSKRA